MLSAGDSLQNRYEIINCIGSGGMADVYKAKDHRLNRNVAIKVLKPEFRGDAEFVSKFRVEAQAAAGLSHPNIVNVYDVGLEDGIYYIVMELVEGITLKEYIRSKGRLSVRETTGISLQIAAGLEAAHKSGIIHRDIKPQNIIISTDGTAKVADFGIARAASSDTINPSAMGSVHYSAPEQARGGYSDERSDIYSLGITMYEMLTGKVPFDGDSTVEVALKHLQEEIISPRQYLPDLPRAIEQIILKSTEKSPDRRYQNMTELIRDLKESLVEPNGNFVARSSDMAKGEPHLYTREELDEINRRTASMSSSGTQGAQDAQEIYGKEKGYPPEDDGDYFDGDDKMPSDEDDPYYDELEDEPENGSTKKREGGKRRHVGAAAILSVLAALLVGITILYLILHTYGLLSGQPSQEGESESALVIDLPGDSVQVPDIRGMEENKAQEVLKGLKLGYRYLGEAASSDYPEGTVMSQSEEPGQKVLVNSTIGYKISTGPDEALTVPDLEGKTRKEAEAALSSMGLQVSVDNTRYSDTVDEGRVITTNPGSGSAVHEGDTVTLYISQGQDTMSVKVPDVTGKYKDEAVTMLTNYGLYVYVTTEPSDTVEQGLVISQDLKPGSSVQTGSAITIIVSAGPEDQPQVVIDPEQAQTQKQTSPVGDMTGQATQQTSTKWVCNAQLNAPDSFTGGSVRITLEQNGIETTVYEGTGDFPYILNVQGADGVGTGTAYVYTLDDNGNVLTKTTYDNIDFNQVDG